MDQPPTGPAPIRDPTRDFTEGFREEALHAILLVVQDLAHATPLPSFWGNGLFVNMHTKCSEFFSDGYIVETRCRHSPFGWRWEIVHDTRRTHPRFVAASVALIETFTHALLGHGGTKKAVNDLTFWAILACARYGLWMRAMTNAYMLQFGNIELAGVDPAWLVQQSRHLDLEHYACLCADTSLVVVTSYSRITTSYTMKIAIKTKNGYRGLALSSSQCYSATDIEDELKTFCREDGLVNSVYVDFSGEYIPLDNYNEVRLISALVCAYHNSCVRANIEDDTYEPYTDPTKIDYKQRSSHTEPSTEDSDSGDVSWDDEISGQRDVYDATYEMNAELTPWCMATREEAEEAFGLYC